MSASSTSASPARPHTVRIIAPRRLAVAWQHPELRSIQPVGLLSFDGEHYEFHYIDNARRVPDFSPFVSFPDLDRSYGSTRLFPLFRQRVMDYRRPDYMRFVKALDLSPEATPWEQLARSEGRRAGDTIILFPEPVIEEDGSTCCNFFVHGIRYMLQENPSVEDRLRSLHKDDRLVLVPEPTNEANSRAILTASTDSVPLGWVPDLLLDYVHAIRDAGTYDLRVRQCNGPDVPVHLRLLVRIAGEVRSGFSPFAGSQWRSLAYPGASSKP